MSGGITQGDKAIHGARRILMPEARGMSPRYGSNAPTERLMLAACATSLGVPVLDIVNCMTWFPAGLAPHESGLPDRASRLWRER